VNKLVLNVVDDTPSQATSSAFICVKTYYTVS
jgi:hypothetical protein